MGVFFVDAGEKESSQHSHLDYSDSIKPEHSLAGLSQIASSL